MSDSVLDPATTGEQLYALAQSRADLLDDIRRHPNCYDGLREWIDAVRPQEIASAPSRADPVGGSTVAHVVASVSAPREARTRVRAPLLLVVIGLVGTTLLNWLLEFPAMLVDLTTAFKLVGVLGAVTVTAGFIWAAAVSRGNPAARAGSAVSAAVGAGTVATVTILSWIFQYGVVLATVNTIGEALILLAWGLIRPFRGPGYIAVVVVVIRGIILTASSTRLYPTIVTALGPSSSTGPLVFWTLYAVLDLATLAATIGCALVLERRHPTVSS